MRCRTVPRIGPDGEPGARKGLDEEVDVTPFDPRVLLVRMRTVSVASVREAEGRIGVARFQGARERCAFEQRRNARVGKHSRSPGPERVSRPESPGSCRRMEVAD
jgi:hypothetical protein